MNAHSRRQSLSVDACHGITKMIPLVYLFARYLEVTALTKSCPQESPTKGALHFVWTIVVECNCHGKETFDQSVLKQFVEKIVCYTRF